MKYQFKANYFGYLALSLSTLAVNASAGFLVTQELVKETAGGDTTITHIDAYYDGSKFARQEHVIDGPEKEKTKLKLTIFDGKNTFLCSKAQGEDGVCIKTAVESLLDTVPGMQQIAGNALYEEYSISSLGTTKKIGNQTCSMHKLVSSVKAEVENVSTIRAKSETVGCYTSSLMAKIALDLSSVMGSIPEKKIAEDYIKMKTLGVALEKTETNSVSGKLMGIDVGVKETEKLKTLAIVNKLVLPELLKVPPGYEVKEQSSSKGLPSVPKTPEMPSAPKLPSF